MTDNGHVLYMRLRRVVPAETRGARHHQVTIAAEMIRQHAEEIARNSLLFCNSVGEDPIVTSLMVTISLSNPQPNVREKARDGGYIIDSPE